MIRHAGGSVGAAIEQTVDYGRRLRNEKIAAAGTEKSGVFGRGPKRGSVFVRQGMFEKAGPGRGHGAEN